MREQLVQYVELLFAGVPDSEEIKEEILQNTLDRYDDLVSHGKSPEAAYRLAISGIGDINEVLGSAPQPGTASSTIEDEANARENRTKHAVSIALYILCPIPLLALSECGYDTIGLCLTLILVAAATALRLTMRRTPKPAQPTVSLTPRQRLTKSINSIIWTIGLVLYFILSFATTAWHNTWLIFPIIGAFQGLVRAIIDLKEAL